MHTLGEDEEPITIVAVSGDSVFCVSNRKGDESSPDDNIVKVWNWRTGEHQSTLSSQSNGSLIALSITENLAISGSRDGTIKIWDWKRGLLIQSMLLRACDCMAFNGDYVLTVNGGNSHVWEWRTGEHVYTLSIKHNHDVSAISIYENYVMTAASQHYLFAEFPAVDPIKIWNWRTGEEVFAVDGHTRLVNVVALTEAAAFSGSSRGIVKVWNWKQTNTVQQVEAAHSDNIDDVDLDGDLALSVSHHEVLVWNWRTGERLSRLKRDFGSRGGVLSNEFVFAGLSSGTVQVWNWQTDELVRTLDPIDDINDEADWSHANSIIIRNEFALVGSGYGGMDSSIMVWNWQTGKLARTLTGHSAQVNSLALHDAYLISAASDQTIRVWNWRTGELIRVLEDNKGINTVVVHEDFAISGSNDEIVKVWNWQTGDPIASLVGHTSWVSDLACIGEILISGSDDGTIKIWNWQTGTCFYTVTFDAAIHSIAVNENFDVIAAGDFLGNVHFMQPNAALRRLLRRES